MTVQYVCSPEKYFGKSPRRSSRATYSKNWFGEAENAIGWTRSARMP